MQTSRKATSVTNCSYFKKSKALGTSRQN